MFHAVQLFVFARCQLSTQNQPTVNPLRVGQGQRKVDGGFDNIVLIRGLRGERLPQRCPRLFTHSCKTVNQVCSVIEEESGTIAVFFLHNSGQMVLYQTPGRRPRRHRASCEHGDPRVRRSPWYNNRALFILHDAVVGFVDRRLSRTRHLAASKYTLHKEFSRLAQHPARRLSLT